jgi:hypothetical protein
MMAPLPYFTYKYNQDLLIFVGVTMPLSMGGSAPNSSGKPHPAAAVGNKFSGGGLHQVEQS